MNFLMLNLILLSSVHVFAYQLGTLSLSGGGCLSQKGSAALQTDETIKFPLQLKLSKNFGSALERKACNFSIPIKLEKNEKVKISNLLQNVKLSSEKSVKTKVSLALFAAGFSATEPFVIETKGDENEKFDRDFVSHLVLFESKCGKDIILRGNLNAFSQGNAKATVETGDLSLSVKATNCQ